MSRFRITIRNEHTELRGYMDAHTLHGLELFAEAMKPYGLVVASPAEDDYNPFREQELRELHHFETEEENERLRQDVRRRDAERAEREAALAATIKRIQAARSNHPDLPVCEKHPDPEDFVKCGWRSAIEDIDKVLAEVPE